VHRARAAPQTGPTVAIGPGGLKIEPLDCQQGPLPSRRRTAGPGSAARHPPSGQGPEPLGFRPKSGNSPPVGFDKQAAAIDPSSRPRRPDECNRPPPGWQATRLCSQLTPTSQLASGSTIGGPSSGCQQCGSLDGRTRGGPEPIPPQAIAMWPWSALASPASNGSGPCLARPRAERGAAWRATAERAAAPAPSGGGPTPLMWAADPRWLGGAGRIHRPVCSGIWVCRRRPPHRLDPAAW